MGKEKRTPVHSIDPTLLPGTVNVNPAVFGKVGTEGAGFWSEWCSECKMGVNLLRDTPRGGTQAQRLGGSVAFLYRATGRFPGFSVVYRGSQIDGLAALIRDGLGMGERLLDGPGTLLAAWYPAG
jgi:hypothetical protein